MLWCGVVQTLVYSGKIYYYILYSFVFKAMEDYKRSILRNDFGIWHQTKLPIFKD